MDSLIKEPYERHVVKTHTQSFVRHTVRVDEKNRSLLNAEAARANCSPDLLLTRLVNRHLSAFVKEQKAAEKAKQETVEAKPVHWKNQRLTRTEMDVLRVLSRMKLNRKNKSLKIFFATCTQIADGTDLDARQVGPVIVRLIRLGLVERMECGSEYAATGTKRPLYAYSLLADLREVMAR